MKRTLLAAAMALTAGSALAADLPPAGPPPRAPAAYVPVVAPVYNWSGIYIGINGGYGFGTSNWSGGGATTGDFNISGPVVGGTIGGNYQMGQFVVGIEGDGDWSNIAGSSSAVACGTTCTTANQWLATIRGRAGFAWDRALIFATGGGAFGDVKATIAGFGTTDTTKTGWTAGAGVEYAITDNLTAKVDYLYVDLGNGSCSPPVCTGTVAVKFTTSIVRAGINFKFSGF